ncbi:MAG: tetratricopeptide repeat protein [Pyrinomonadaceae bacterium]
MKRLLNQKVALYAAVFCLMLAFEGIAYGQTNRIGGQVYGADRRPLSEINVELLNEIDAVLSRTKTNGAGAYFFVNMSAGRFTIRVRTFGTDYEEQAAGVEVVNIVMGGRSSTDSVQQDFYLRTTRESAAKRRKAPGVVFAQAVPPDAEKAFGLAMSEFDANRPDRGFAELHNAIQVYPEYFLALERLGVESLKIQKYADARKYFERAVAVNARSSNCWYGLSYARYVENNPPDAVEAAKKAAELAPESADISLMLGVAQRKNKDYPDAEKSMIRAKKLSGNKLADASWNLALLYVYNIKDKRRAAEELENYLKIRPDHPNADQLKKLISQFRLGA